MKTKTIITDITKEDLVNLLCTATYGSYYWSVDIPEGSYYGTELEDKGDCLEDKWAKVLLAGKPVFVYDYSSEECSYGNLPHKWDKEENAMRYDVTLDDIRNGLQKCADGTFKVNDNKEAAYIKSCFADLIEDDSANMDLTEAEDLLQVIVFNEIIYG